MATPEWTQTYCCGFRRRETSNLSWGLECPWVSVWCGRSGCRYSCENAWPTCYYSYAHWGNSPRSWSRIKEAEYLILGEGEIDLLRELDQCVEDKHVGIRIKFVDFGGQILYGFYYPYSCVARIRPEHPLHCALWLCGCSKPWSPWTDFLLISYSISIIIINHYHYHSVCADQLLLLLTHPSFGLVPFLAGKALVTRPVYAILELASPTHVHVWALALHTLVSLVFQATLNLADAPFESVVVEAIDAPSSFVAQAAILWFGACPIFV